MSIWLRACGVGCLCAGVLLALAGFSATPGSLDLSFQPSGWITNGVEALLLRSDGQILVGQSQPPRILRLHNDGSDVEAHPFPPSAEWAGFYTLKEQPDGKILWQGDYKLAGDEWSQSGVFRMNLDGTRDSSFVPMLLSNRSSYLRVVPEGFLVTGQQIENYASQFNYLHRLRLDGSLDSDFPELRLTNTFIMASLLASSKLLFCWASETNEDSGFAVFTHHNGRWLTNRLVTWTNFAPQFLAPHSEGKFLISGPLATNGGDYTTLFRIGIDGAVDESFAPLVYAGWFSSIALDRENRVLVAGIFGDSPTNVSSRVARFSADGAPDPSFQSPEMSGYISSLQVQADGQILIQGNFYIETNIPAASIARLNGDSPPPIPSVHWSAAEYVASESASNGVLTLVRSHASGAVSFELATEEGTAQAGEDYGATAGPFRFPAGSLTATIAVPLLDNRMVDGPRRFAVAVSNMIGGEMVGSTATVVIADDEVTNRVQFSAAYFAGKETQSNVLVEVVRELGSPGEVRVAYRTRDGTALAGRDYLPVTGTLDFAAGQFTNSFVVPILNTAGADGNRYAGLELFAPQDGAVINGQTNATLALLDDESPAMVVTPTEAFLRAAVIGGGIVRFATDGVVHLAAGIPLDENTTMEANGHGIILSGEGTTRHLMIRSNAQVTLDGLTFIDGSSTNGGAIYNEGTLNLRACVFSNNVAAGWSGVAGVQGTNGLPDTNNVWLGTPAGDGGHAESGQAGAGGAIFNTGELVAINSSFLANSARGGNGGAGGRGGNTIGVTSPGKGGNGGDAGPAWGGAILTLGNARLSGCLFIANAALAGSAGEYGSSGSNSDNSYGPDQASGDAGLAADAGGGAIFAMHSIQLLGCQFESNVVAAADGGAGAPGISSWSQTWGGSGSPGRAGQHGGSASGGALSSSGFAVLSNNVWIGNGAVAGHGGLGGNGGSARSRSGSTYPGGAGANGGNGGVASGGAIAGQGSFSIDRDLFLSNYVESGSGAKGGNGGQSDGRGYGHNPAAGDSGAGRNAEGGAIAHRGSFRATGIKATGNTAHAGTGGWAANPGTGVSGIYVSAGAPGIPGTVGHAFGGALFVEGEGAVTDCEFTFNSAQGGAGIDGWSSPYYRLRFDGPDGGDGVKGGSAFGGGAHLGGTTIIERSTIASNIVVGGAGGKGGTGVNSLYEASRGGLGARGGDTWGGGLFLNGSARITNATIAFNECRPGQGGDGGSGDAHQFSPSASIDPTRPGGNAGSVVGSGVAVGAESSAMLAFSTVASNRFLSATGGVGAAVETWFRAADGSNSVVFGTGVAGEGGATLRACLLAADPLAPQLGTNVIDGGFNLCSDPAGSLHQPSSVGGVNPRLGPLADKGGPTRTMALLSGSPAIDAGDDATCPSTDQRGVLRPFGTRCDIGAFELQEQTFTLSGWICGLGGATATVIAGDVAVATDASGFYAIRNLRAGSYQVTPHWNGVQFLPATQRIDVGPDVHPVNFAADVARVRWLAPDHSGTLLLQGLGLPGEQYALETSTNLLEWALVQLLEMDTNGSVQVQPAISTNEPNRYFRLQRR